MTLTLAGSVTLGTILEGIFYGVYIVLFILYLVLQRRNSHRVGGPLTLAQILLFGLCTTSLCLDISGNYFIDIQYMDAAGMSELVSLGQGFAYAGLIKFSLKSVGSGKFGHLSVLIGIAAYSISLGANALTTSLIVTKIFLTSRQVRSVLGPSSDRSIRIATAMLIESGLLMFAFQLVFIVLFSSGTTMVNIIFGPTAQRYGITPTLLNIRVMMGTAYDKTTENSTTSLRFAHSGGAATQTTGLSTSAAGVQFKGPRGIDTESDETSSDERATDDAV